MAMDTRAKELLSIVEENIVDKKHASTVKAAAAPYLMTRERTLFKGMEDLLKYGISSQRVEVGDKWSTALKKAIEQMGKSVKLIATAQKNLPEERRTTEITIAAHESAFVQAVGKLMGVGAQVDVIIKLGLDLNEKSADLLEVWDDLQDDFEDAEKKMEAAQKDIQKTIDDTVKSIAANQKTAYQLALDVGEYLEKAPDEVNPLTLLGQFAPFAKWLLTLKNTYAVQLGAKEKVWARETMLERELAKRGVGVVMFAELRESVKKFLKSVNVETSVKAVKAAREMMKGAVDACVLPSQKADMAAFVKELDEHIEDAHEKMVSAHDKFIAAHAGIFFGTASSKTMKILLNEERWKKARDQVRISQLNNALRRLYDFDYVAVPLKDYDGDKASVLKNYLKKTLGDLYEDIEETAEAFSLLPEEYSALMDQMAKHARKVK